ncbi:MAG: HemY N protein [Gammaproteobacteria bacterium]|nr:HemY N protein [Gammaproteobacteria bacterium]
MRWLIAILGALAAALVVGIFLQNHPGAFILTLGDTTIQASFAFFVAALLFISILLAMLMLILLGLANLPKNYRRWARQKRSRQSEQYLTQGLLSAHAGDWRRAETAFRKGAAYSRTPSLNYLQAATAAQQQGHLPQRDQYLRLAQEQAGDAAVAVSLGQAELQLRQQQTEQAYATLKNLPGKGSGRDQTHLMLLKASAQLREWHGVLENLEQLRGTKLLPAAQIRAYQIAAYTGLLQHAGRDADQDRLDAVWLGMPKKLRRELPILETYIQERLRYAETKDCEALLRTALKRQWDPTLIRLYGLVQGADNAKQLACAEQLLTEHARDPVLLLTIGRLCRRNSLWGKARSCLEESLALQPGPEACQELATLLEQEGDQAGAAACYRQGLLLATGISAGAVKLLRHRPGNPGRE